MVLPEKLERLSIFQNHSRFLLTELKELMIIRKIYSIIDHWGELESGHYTNRSKIGKTNKWACFNDSSVYPINLELENSTSASILFYQQKSEK